MADEELETVVLTDENGNDVEFSQVASIVLPGDRHYAILQPVELLEGMGEDEAFVFEVKFNGDKDASLTIVDDDKVVDEVFKEYNRLLDEEEENN